MSVKVKKQEYLKGVYYCLLIVAFFNIARTAFQPLTAFDTLGVMVMGMMGGMMTAYLTEHMHLLRKVLIGASAMLVAVLVVFLQQ